MSQVMVSMCEKLGMTNRQVFQEARVAFTGMDTQSVRGAANNQYDDWMAGGPLPDYVEKWALQKLIEKKRNNSKAQKKFASSELVPQTLFDNDCA